MNHHARQAGEFAVAAIAFSVAWKVNFLVLGFVSRDPSERLVAMSYLFKIVLVLEVCVALCAHEVRLNLMPTPQSLTFMAPIIFDVALTAFAVEVPIFQMIIETGTAREIHLAVRADIMTA
jgi:hypothetical protein